MNFQGIEPWNLIFFNNLFNSISLYRADIVINCKISLWRGDITKLNVDCIVNTASENLEVSGGIDGAIDKASGPELLDACKKFPIDNEINTCCKTGECKITTCFNLLAKDIIHTVNPKDKNIKLKCSYENCLKKVLTSNVKMIGICCIAAVIFNFS